MYCTFCVLMILPSIPSVQNRTAEPVRYCLIVGISEELRKRICCFGFLNSAYINHHLFSVGVCVCTTLHRTEYLMHLLPCGIYMHTHHSDLHIKYWSCMAYMPNLMGIFVSGIYSGLTCEVEAAVGYGVAYVCKNVGSICPFSMLYIHWYIWSVVSIFVQWYVKFMFSAPYWMLSTMCAYISYIYMFDIWNICPVWLAFFWHVFAITCSKSCIWLRFCICVYKNVGSACL